jgi:hypothetical protein
VVSLDQLETAFEREGRIPKCLEAVLHEMWAASQLVDLTRYLGTLLPRPTWASWLRGVGVTAMQVSLYLVKWDEKRFYVILELKLYCYPEVQYPAKLSDHIVISCPVGRLARCAVLHNPRRRWANRSQDSDRTTTWWCLRCAHHPETLPLPPPPSPP